MKENHYESLLKLEKCGRKNSLRFPQKSKKKNFDNNY